MTCIDPGFGYENKDGYVRISPEHKSNKLVMRHRWFWELQRGKIPEAMELDHICKNRRCCNVNHLQLIDRSTHASNTNKERYAEVRKQGLEMLRLGISKDEVAKVLGRSRGSINLWLRWEKND